MDLSAIGSVAWARLARLTAKRTAATTEAGNLQILFLSHSQDLPCLAHGHAERPVNQGAAGTTGRELPLVVLGIPVQAVLLLRSH